MAVIYPSFDDLKRRKIREVQKLLSLEAKAKSGPGSGSLPGMPFFASQTPTPSPTISVTPTISITPSNTPTPTFTPTYTITPTQTPTYTITNTVTTTITPSHTQTATYTSTYTITPTYTVTNTITRTNTPTHSETPTQTPTISITPSNTPTISITPTITPTISRSSTPTPTLTKTPTHTPTISRTATSTPTLNFVPSPTPTGFLNQLIGPGNSYAQGVGFQTENNCGIFFNGTASGSPTPFDMFLYYNGVLIAIVTLSPSRNGQPYTFIPDVSNPLSPRFNRTFAPGNVFLTDIFEVSPTPDVSVTPTLTPTSTPTLTNTITRTNQTTPTPTPTYSPTPSLTPTKTLTPTRTPTCTPTYTLTPSNFPEYILIDTASFEGVVSEPFLSALTVAAERWNSFLTIPKNRLNAIRSIDPGFSGIYLNNYTLYNDPGSNTIASCGPNNFYSFVGNHQLISENFNLNINTRWVGTYTQEDWENILAHELGHALGVGIYWDSFFSIYGSEPPTNYFLNASAYSALSGAYGALIGPRPRVALESAGGSGTSSAHWENDFRSSAAAGSLGFNYPGLLNELMVGFYFSGFNQTLSPISIKMLTDFGYTEINPGSSEGNPSLDPSLVASLDINTAAGNIVKLDCCQKEFGYATAIFDESNKPIAFNAIVVT